MKKLNVRRANEDNKLLIRIKRISITLIFTMLYELTPRW